MSDTLETRPISGTLGAEVTGADLRDVDEALFERIHAALLEHEVLFFRDPKIDDDQHVALANRWGPVSVFPLIKALGSDEPSFQVIRDGPDSPPAADEWHTDVTWTPEPPKLALLRATLVPDRGGDTMWGSMTAAYDALSEPVRAFLDGLTVFHDCTTFLRGVVRKMGAEQAEKLGVEVKLRAMYPGVEHPLVRTHPETGKRALLFGGGFMRHIVGLAAHESDAVMKMVREHIEQPRFHCRWSWKPGDLAIWDERSTVHRAIGDHFPREREVRRCVVDGDRPYFDAEADSRTAA
jgi:taurine dioxygenase